MTGNQWTEVTEVEVVLRITKPVTTLVQTEIHYTSAFGYVLKKNALDLLRSEHLSVVDLEKVGVKKSLVRVDRPVMELTSVVKPLARVRNFNLKGASAAIQPRKSRG